MNTKTAATVLLVALTMGFAAPREHAPQGTPVGASIRVFGADAEHAQLVRWAAQRYEAAGIGAPAVEIHFNRSNDACGGHQGYAKAGRVDICTVLVNAMTRRIVLHEMGHIWLDQNIGTATRERFVEMRGLSSWNSSSDEWRVRGYEQGAEVLAWELGERIITPEIPDNDPERMNQAFEVLTGVPASVA